MKKLLLAASMAAVTSGVSAFELPDLSKAYGSGMFSYVATEEARPSTYGTGLQLIGGVPLSDKVNLEATTFLSYLPRDTDDTADGTLGLGLDLVAIQRKGMWSSLLLAGAGGIYDDVSSKGSVAPYINFGVGAARALPWKNLSIRGEARVVYDFNDHLGYDPNEKTGAGTDYRLNLGLVYGLFGQEPVPPPPADTDGDGVADPSDQCPNTPPGTAVDAVGCPLPPADTDGDGVVDTLDQCPDTPAGTVVDARGCPPPAPVGNPDLDGDGVLNDADQCPDTPQGFKVDGVGCLVEQTVALQSVNFEFGSDALTAEAKAILDGIAKSLAAQTAVKVQVTGHTDSLGPQSYNLTLSQKRAKSVIAYLTSVGVATERLSAEGEGEFSPIASNDTEEGRAKNRRVEFKILTQ
ncbi:MAG: hypothetical protein EPN60_05095 [Nevskiaceae bacterium]|jgi:OOP family OmpA-OmpF porin|nr:MAG: hypothetical protein EPO48_02210 [Nevskiaceae bacterium]TAM30477.1 MAG: hypothetical protein EPN60_05095 [Nevskiaceae bacterium]